MHEGQLDGLWRLILPCMGCEMGNELVGPHVKTQPHLTAFVLARWYH